MALSAEKALNSIHTMHVLIEKIFTGTHVAEDLALLSAHFSTDFTMIGAAGKCLTLEQVQQLFIQNQAKMPDIKIEIYDEKIILQQDNAIVLTYTEKHSKSTGTLIRHSCALIEEIDGKMQWRYLQETFLA
ncbi:MULTISPECIES: DUF4440 domain-containing protein [unclassified Acinetobacter]|uniref:DUF4440 domain-containing protein n=1 Tax=unclassified Acinetobacter TaxID=196816 RepID=UPI00293490C8|nr:MULTISPECIES: DUF4440 domain-containing protein [unclassified Acinetobacter]WOE32623.1 DUF4440 domain-containing protein [Acinetobacter sp. SAAs470]WOE38099.1 DUF4440 domain-containing protein [Acinetobacter sp. SAAs474]